MTHVPIPVKGHSYRITTRPLGTFEATVVDDHKDPMICYLEVTKIVEPPKGKRANPPEVGKVRLSVWSGWKGAEKLKDEEDWWPE